MLQKYRKHIFAILAVLLVGLLLWGIFFYYSVPRLSKEEKELVRKEYINQYCGGDTKNYLENPIIWYDENWHIEENGVWRYVGTYGDCYALLRIGDNIYDYLRSENTPHMVLGLPRPVVYPNEAEAYLYHTKREFNSVEANWIVDGTTVRMERIHAIMNLDQWITEEQLEQLTQDIEKIAK